MFAYRYNPYLSPTTQELPTFPFVSFTNALDLSRLRMYPLDWAEETWNQQQSLSCVLHYDDSDVFYFILPSNIECPTTADIRRLTMDHAYDEKDHHCDYYAKPTLQRFMEKLNIRLHTRTYLTIIESSIPFLPTDLEYHQLFLEKVHIDHNDDQYEMSLIQSMVRKSQEVINNHHDYSPDGKGMDEAKQDFEELTLLTMKI
jgi:hypothetical protein